MATPAHITTAIASHTAGSIAGIEAQMNQMMSDTLAAMLNAADGRKRNGTVRAVIVRHVSVKA